MKIKRIEPCHHCWLYYQRKVDARRKKKLPCSNLENMMWDYSMHAAFPMGIVQGARQEDARLGSKDASNLSYRRTVARNEVPSYKLNGWETDGRALRLPVDTTGDIIK